MNVEKSEAYMALRDRRDAILAQIAPLQERADALQRDADRATAAVRAVREEIAALERANDLRGVSMALAALARSMGAYSIKAAGLGER